MQTKPSINPKTKLSCDDLALLMGKHRTTLIRQVSKGKIPEPHRPTPGPMYWLGEEVMDMLR